MAEAANDADGAEKPKVSLRPAPKKPEPPPKTAWQKFEEGTKKRIGDWGAFLVCRALPVCLILGAIVLSWNISAERSREETLAAVRALTPAPAAVQQTSPVVVQSPPVPQAPRIYANAEIAAFAKEAERKLGQPTGGFAVTYHGEPPRAGCEWLEGKPASDGGTFRQWRCPKVH